MRWLDAVRCSPRRWLVVPAAAVLVVLVLTALDLNGSSVALNEPATTPGLVAGEPRPIRSDEWWARATAVVRQDELGFPATVDAGMGEHRVGAIDTPTYEWTLALRPQQWGYVVLDVGRAYTFEWWFTAAVLALGIFALLYTLTRRIVLSALLGIVTVASPVVQWWTSPANGSVIGYFCLALAVLVTAVRSDETRPRVLWAVLGGWLLACAVVVPYPAWVIPMLLGLLPMAVWLLIVEPWRAHGWRRSVSVLAPTAAVSGVLVVAFVATYRSVFSAIASTVYPGDRVEPGGTGDVLRLLSAPFFWFVARNPAEPITVLGTNESEASGPLVLLLPAAIVVAMLTLVAARSSLRTAALALLAGAGALMVWFLVPVPARVGQFLLLDQVPANRLLHTFAPLGAIAFGLAVHLALERPGQQRRVMGVSAGVAVFLATAWAGGEFTIDGQPLSFIQVTAWAAVIAVGVALAITGPSRTGLGLLAAAMLVVAVQTNPLQRGLEPLTSSSTVAAIREVADSAPERAWVATSRERPVTGALAASGVPAVSGTSVYPDLDTWRIIDPDEAAIDAWNRFAHVVATPLPDGAPTTITLLSNDAVEIGLDLCGPDARALGIGFALLPADQPVPSCAALVRSLEGPVGPLSIVELPAAPAG